MMEFDFNGHGSFNLKILEQSAPRSTAKLQTHCGAVIQLNEADAPKPNGFYKANSHTGRTWYLNDEEKQQVADAFHLVGLFIDKVFPELKDQGYRFVREEFSVRLIVGDIDSPNAPQHSSTYSPVKTFENPYYSNREFPELNIRLVPEGASEFAKTFLLAMNALENHAHDQALPDSHKIGFKDLHHQ